MKIDWVFQLKQFKWLLLLVEVVAWIEKTVENQSVFMKIGEIGLDRFHRFL
jgi:Tat protein secretion system quality control protein TatD with DNase activity